MELKVEELVYGYKGNETYLTLYLTKATLDELKTIKNRGGIYMIYDKQGDLMYVGESTRLQARIRDNLSPNHGKKEINKETFGHVLYQYVGVDRYERHVIEGLLVTKYRPPLNCGDDAMHEARAFVDEKTSNDVLYYVRNTSIKDTVIAKAFKVKRETVYAMRIGASHSHVVLPKDYTPSIKITKEFIENNKHVRKPITQNMFNEARELLAEGLVKQNVIATKLGISAFSVNRIKGLKAPHFVKWEEQRLEKAVA